MTRVQLMMLHIQIMALVAERSPSRASRKRLPMIWPRKPAFSLISLPPTCLPMP